MTLDAKTLTSIGTAAAILVAAATALVGWSSGYLQLQTVDCHRCELELAVSHERLVHMEQRIEANEQAIEACRALLESNP